MALALVLLLLSHLLVLLHFNLAAHVYKLLGLSTLGAALLPRAVVEGAAPTGDSGTEADFGTPNSSLRRS
jgi:hypothetical protein